MHVAWGVGPCDSCPCRVSQVGHTTRPSLGRGVSTEHNSELSRFRPNLHDLLRTRTISSEHKRALPNLHDLLQTHTVSADFTRSPQNSHDLHRTYTGSTNGWSTPGTYMPFRIIASSYAFCASVRMSISCGETSQNRVGNLRAVDPGKDSQGPGATKWGDTPNRGASSKKEK